MKKILFLLLPAALLLAAWKVGDVPANTNMKSENKAGGVIRYEFTASIAATYGIATNTNEEWSDERIPTSTYSKTVVTEDNSVSASMTIYPPYEWENTGTVGKISMQIYYNDRLVATKDAEIYYADRHPGITLTAFVK